MREWKLDVDGLLRNTGGRDGGGDERFVSTNTSPVLASGEQTTQHAPRTRGGSGSGSARDGSGGDLVNAQQQKGPAVGV